MTKINFVSTKHLTYWHIIIDPVSGQLTELQNVKASATMPGCTRAEISIGSLYMDDDEMVPTVEVLTGMPSDVTVGDSVVIGNSAFDVDDLEVGEKYATFTTAKGIFSLPKERPLNYIKG